MNLPNPPPPARRRIRAGHAEEFAHYAKARYEMAERFPEVADPLARVLAMSVGTAASFLAAKQGHEYVQFGPGDWRCSQGCEPTRDVRRDCHEPFLEAAIRAQLPDAVADVLLVLVAQHYNGGRTPLLGDLLAVAEGIAAAGR